MQVRSGLPGNSIRPSIGVNRGATIRFRCVDCQQLRALCDDVKTNPMPTRSEGETVSTQPLALEDVTLQYLFVGC